MSEDLALTPRTRQLLLIAADLLFDEGREDLDQVDPNPWGLFERYPRLAKTQNAVWRRRALHSFDDLAADIRRLGTPIPRCTADEVALWLMVDRASAIEEDREAWPTLWSTVIEHPARPDDFDRPSLRENLFEDTDFLMLYAPELDGVDDPDDEINQSLGIGEHLHPRGWFTLFGGETPRPPGTG
ncbi:MAG TPA: hypothetical protein VIU11_16295 [Nakamurella sp.]